MGIDKASRTFYGKSAYELTLMEAATLAGVLKAPTNYNPARHPEEASARAKLVLANMVSEGYITKDEALEAIDNPSKAATRDYTPGHPICRGLDQCPAALAGERQHAVPRH